MAGLHILRNLRISASFGDRWSNSYAHSAASPAQRRRLRQQLRLHIRFIELAGEINTQMPEHVVYAVADALNTQRKPIKRSNILILGLAYKPNVDDERESPSYVLMKLLAERGAEITYYDPYVPVIKPARDYSQFAGRKSVAWNRATIENFDLVLIATNHSSVNYHELGEWARCNRGYAERDGGHARIARKSLEA